MARRRVSPPIVRWLSGLLASVTMVAAVSVPVAFLSPYVLPMHLLVLYLLVILPVAIVWGTGLAAVTSVLSAAVYAYFFLPPVHSFEVSDSRSLVELGVFLVTAVVVGQLAARSRRAALESQEQAALRRVATLIARGVPPADVFSAVAEELAKELGASITNMLRYEDDGTATVVGGWSEPGTHIPAGTRLKVAGQDIAGAVLQTGVAARTERFDGPPGSVARSFADAGVTAGAGSPIVVEGRLWGIAIAASPNADALPAATEHRIADFAELVATAVSNAQARTELRRIADEQAALRRVATLVAGGAPPAEVFRTVAEEVGHVVPVADFALVGRYDPDGVVEFVGAWSRTGTQQIVGRRTPLGGRNVNTLVFERNRPARADHLTDAASAGIVAARELGARSSAGAPISVEGRLWGVMIVASTHEDALPAGVENRLAKFTGLVATAIANAEARAELTASRARVVATADETRRRIERDLHDGAQQRLVSLALQLRATQAAVPPECGAELDRLHAGLTSVHDELREYARGIHPATLTEGGLAHALRVLARRASVPVELDVRTKARLPGQIEVAAYYVVSEALTNAAKHAHASAVVVAVEAADDVLCVLVRDDGVGGADFTCGTGLLGLKDRVEAFGGRISLDSPRGMGTTLRVELPLITAGHVTLS